jgi:hypothetical protein
MIEQPYRSIEQRIEDNVLKPAGNSMYDFIKYAYSTVAGVCRLPTTVRKIYNDQDIWSKLSPGRISTSRSWGIMAGGFVDIAATIYTLQSTSDGNFLPLGILLTSNALSGIYELGRIKTTKREHRAIQLAEEKAAKERSRKVKK